MKNKSYTFLVRLNAIDKNGINHGRLFLCWTTKKHNYHCWHYSLTLRRGRR